MDRKSSVMRRAIDYILTNFGGYVFMISYINIFFWMIRLLSCLCCVLLVHSETLPFSLVQTVSLEDRAVDIDMTKNGEYLYVTSHTYGVKVLVRQKGTFEEDVVQPVQPYTGHPYYRDVDVTADGEWLVFTPDWAWWRRLRYVYKLSNTLQYQQVQTLGIYYDGENSVAITDDHRFVVVGQSDPVHVYEFSGNKFEYVQRINVKEYSVDLSADGEWLVIGGYATNSWVYRLDNSSYVLYQTFTHPNGRTEVDLADQAPVLVLGVRGAMYAVYILQNSTWELKDKFHCEQVRRPSLSSDGQWMVLSKEYESQIYRYIDDEYKPLGSVWGNDSQMAVKVSSDGRTLAVAMDSLLEIYQLDPSCIGFSCDSCCVNCSSSLDEYLFPSLPQCSFYCGIEYCKPQICSGEPDLCEGADSIYHFDCPWTIVILVCTIIIDLIVVAAFVFFIRYMLKEKTEEKYKQKEEEQSEQKIKTKMKAAGEKKDPDTPLEKL